jgi:ATP-binding cassette subfamily C protein CydD
MHRVDLARLGIRRGVVPVVVVGLCGTLVLIGQMALLSAIVAAAFRSRENLATLAGPLAWLAAAALLRALLAGGRELAARETAIRAKAGIRARLLGRLIARGPLALRGERTGDVLATATEGVERIDPYVSRYLPQVALSLLAPLLIGAAVLTQDWVSGLILLLTAPVLPLLMILVGTYAQEQVRGQWTALARMHAHLLEALQGLSTLVVFGCAQSERERLRRIGQAYRRRTLGSLRYAFLSSLVLEFLTAGAIALLAVILGLRLLAGGISFQRAFFVLLLTPEFYRPLRELGLHRHAAMEAGAAMERVAELLAETAASGDDRASARGAAPAGAQSARALRATELAEASAETRPALAGILPRGPITVAFEQVGYRYPGTARPALWAIDLLVPAGTRTALVGRSGAGKSTLVNLLQGHAKPDEGRILVNDLPLAAMPVEAWRQLVAVVPQRPYLFAGTLRQNICLGRPRASQREIEEAAALSGAAQFIELLPRGYDTQVGERGARLSGGEIQRLAMARAFLRQAPLLLLG